MKKKQKKSKKRKKTKKKYSKKKPSKILKKKIKKIRKINKKRTKKFKRSHKKKIYKVNAKELSKIKKDSFALKLVKLQLSLKPEFNFKINFNLEKYIQGFFDRISEIISNYKIIKHDEKRRIKLEKIENERKAKIAFEKQKLDEEVLRVKFKEQALKDEAKLEKQRSKDIKLFLRKEQALLRIEQAEKQKQFLKQLRLDKQIEKFRIREVKELEKT